MSGAIPPLPVRLRGMVLSWDNFALLIPHLERVVEAMTYLNRIHGFGAENLTRDIYNKTTRTLC